MSRIKRFLTALRPFFELPRKSWKDQLSLFMGLLALAVIIFEVLVLDIYYDEAFTYLGSGRISKIYKIFQFKIANFHALNSFLMAFTTLLLPFNEFAIRLPALLFGLFYIFISINISRKFKNRLLILALLLFYDHLLLFHAMARGYGMCATLLLAALFIYVNKDRFLNWPLWLCGSFLLAFYANFVALPFIVCFLAYVFIVDWKWRLPNFKRSAWLTLIGFFALGIYGFYNASKSGRPLYGAYKASFFEAIPHNTILHFTKWFTPELLTSTLITVVLASLVLFLYFFKDRLQAIGLITLATFLLIFILARLLDKPLPTGRALLPFWPPLVISLAYLLEYFSRRIQISAPLKNTFQVALAAVICVNALVQIPFGRLYRNYSDKWQIPITALSEYNWNNETDFQYYLKKDRYHKITLHHFAEMQAAEIRQKKGVKMEFYRQVGAAQLIVESSQTDSLCKTIYRQSGQHSQLKIALEDSATQSRNKYVYLQSLQPGKGVDSVELRSCKGPGWSFTFQPDPPQELRHLNAITWAARKNKLMGSNFAPAD